MSGNFVDTNMFIYWFDETNEHKCTLSEQLIQKALKTRNACISYQVIQETLNIVTRKLSFPINAENAEESFVLFVRRKG
ncbi:MAG: PIN domain-containing protein [Nitrosomonas sp.]|nr:MAG: PIN domain-containing protein [Nitrosomonas sp.]